MLRIFYQNLEIQVRLTSQNVCIGIYFRCVFQDKCDSVSEMRQWHFLYSRCNIWQLAELSCHSCLHFWGWGLQWDGGGGCTLCVLHTPELHVKRSLDNMGICEVWKWYSEIKHVVTPTFSPFCAEFLRYENVIEGFLWSNKWGLGCAGSAASLGCPMKSCRPVLRCMAHLVCGEECERWRC